MADVVLAFDLYGTLLSTASIANALAKHLGDDHARAVATTWRTLQLEYTWRLNSMQLYEPFSTVTANSLKHALRAHGHSFSAQELERVLAAYDALSTFPDTAPALTALAKSPSTHAVVFSNGTPSMLENSIQHSPDLSPYASVFRDVVSVDEVKRFKPHPAVYRHLAKRVGMRGKEDRVWLVSGNPFDIVGARAAGLQAAWVNRERGTKEWEDCLDEEALGRPTVEVASLEEVEEKVKAWLKERA